MLGKKISCDWFPSPVQSSFPRPERLDTVEEVSEPASGISSQLTSLTYSQDMDQVVSLIGDILTSSNTLFCRLPFLLRM